MSGIRIVGVVPTVLRYELQILSQLGDLKRHLKICTPQFSGHITQKSIQSNFHDFGENFAQVFARYKPRKNGAESDRLPLFKKLFWRVLR
jgi:hypothetical protein